MISERHATKPDFKPGDVVDIAFTESIVTSVNHGGTLNLQTASCEIRGLDVSDDDHTIEVVGFDKKWADGEVDA